MMLSIFVIVFVLVMMYWWALQGFFSGLLHLLIVIACGVLAFAFWEPLAHFMLSFDKSFAAKYAWGVSLLAVFTVSLCVFRPVMDKLVGKNMHFPDIADKLLGAVCGGVAAWFTAGITVIGISFLPLYMDIGGWHPYEVAGTGRIERTVDGDGEETGGLMLPVDTTTASFFTGLSGGAFRSSHPMARYTPDLGAEAPKFRVAGHETGSKVVSPKNVRVVSAHWLPEKSELPASVFKELSDANYRVDPATHPNNRILVVDTQWTKSESSYDKMKLYLYPSQVVLMSEDKDGGQAKLDRPAGMSIMADRITKTREFTPANSKTTVITTGRDDRIACLFVVDGGNEPYAIKIRNLRSPLKITDAKAKEVTDLIGEIKVKPKVVEGDNGNSRPPKVNPGKGVSPQHEAIGIAETDKLPKEISRNLASKLDIPDGQPFVRGGTAWVEYPKKGISQKMKVTSIETPAGYATVRLKVDKDIANGILAQAIGSAGALGIPYLTTNLGDKIYPVGYVLYQSSKKQKIHVDQNQVIQSAKQVPFNDMEAGDAMYLYFHVQRERGLQIKEYRVGSRHEQPIDPPLKIAEEAPTEKRRR